MPVTRSTGRGKKPTEAQQSSSSGTPTTTTTDTSGTAATTTTGYTERTESSLATSGTAVTESCATEATGSTTRPQGAGPGTTVSTEERSQAAPTAETGELIQIAPTATENRGSLHLVRSEGPMPTTIEDRSASFPVRGEGPAPTTTENRNASHLVRSEGPLNTDKKKRNGSVKSTSKAYKVLKAKEEVLRLKVELAAARLAALEADTEDEDDASVYSKMEPNTRVDEWLQGQTEAPMLAITNEPHRPITERNNHPPAEATRIQNEEQTAMQEAPQPVHETAQAATHQQRHFNSRSEHLEYQVTPVQASHQIDFAKFTEAITLAVKSSRPRMMELPFFNGSHQEWLNFNAAYFETEKLFSKAENLNRLRRHLKGRAKEAVESQLISNTDPKEIMDNLETRFGRPDTLARMEINALKTLPRLTESPKDICIFYSRVANSVATLKTLNCVHHLYNAEAAQALVEKMTSTLRFRFFDFAASLPKDEPKLIKIEKFFKREAALCGPYAEPEQIKQQDTSNNRRQQRLYNITENKEKTTSKCIVCDETGHNITTCETFKKADENERWDIAKNKKLCFRCLRYRNRTHSCRQRTCGINNCRYYHHRLLHFNKTAERTEKIEEIETKEAINSAWTPKKLSYLKIIPVTASGPTGEIETFALLDDGSTVTLIDEKIANRIGATGPIDPLKIEAINELKTAESSSRRIQITLKGANNREERIEARTIKNFNITTQEVSMKHLEECEHLRNISKFLTYEEAKPSILIGQDNWNLLTSKRIKKGRKDQPVASLTPLGWVLHGVQTHISPKKYSQFVNHLIEEQMEESLDEMMKKYFTMDSLCINPKKPKSDPEEQATRILEKHTVHINGSRYETALLWKKEDSTLPDNYENSLKRLHNIEKKLDKNPQLKQKYTEQMDDLIKKGYAEPAPKQKKENRTWYLPHFGVVNPMKPEKLRVVHDAAAKTRGVSLNDLLYKGPDLLESLPGVVMRFRQHTIAVTADIKEMFMQVKLREEDRDSLRYLWRGNRRDNQPPEEYRMTSLIFGASSSPATAIYVKNINAMKHEKAYPEAAKAIIKKHYVDDCLDSFESLEDAIRVTTNVKEIHRKAGFELKQWKSNSSKLLQAIGEANCKEDTEFYKSEDRTERVLGLIWKPEKDEFTFNLNLTRIPLPLIEGKKATKREALKIVMSLFDPLGFAAPVTVKAKQILQEVWRRGTTWDEEIEEDLAIQWNTWLTELRNLSRVAIPRSYPLYSKATTLQLHIFTDASEAAYSTALYWRAISPNGDVNVSLVMAKARVTPLKITSIPRLELQAAVLGTRLAEIVIEEHERKPDRKIFWTDSKTVLTWLRTGSRSYKPYVAHRIAAIEESTTVNEWRWVPTKLNVADDATRDVPANFNGDHRWYKGPEFLYTEENTWPIENSPSTATEVTGEERVNHISDREEPKLSEALPDVTRFSNWERLCYATARVLQFIQLCQRTKQAVNYKRTLKNKESDPDWKKETTRKPRQQQKQKITEKERKYLRVPAETLLKAEELLMRSSQQDSFKKEMDEIKKEKTVKKESRLSQLSIEHIDGVIRLRSRIDAAQQISDTLRNPMIIDGNHQIVKLWIQNIHRKLHHAGVEATVNECRQQYWILRVRPITRSIIRRCLYCRMRTLKPSYPRTGNLPSCRLAHHQRPFTFTGVDYFGPLTVTVGRAHQKRYVAIFTCLTTRAIHLEIAGSLSSSSAIMALRRMITRRGCPAEIWSDNGTNLKGADKELRQIIDDETAEDAAKRRISWRYIPPGAPFMGGAWERMVKSVKTALATKLTEKYPTEEVLSTLLAEVEYTVNSRPLTHVSVEAEDPEALTPNHFLLGGPGRVPVPGKFSERDTVSTANWRAAQRLSDLFWERWLKEYLPELQNRREPHGKGPELKIGDLVQIVDTNVPRNTWLRGKVIETFPGPDNVIRTADIQTQNGVLRRPTRKLVILPIHNTIEPAPELVENHTAGEMCRTAEVNYNFDKQDS